MDYSNNINQLVVNPDACNRSYAYSKIWNEVDFISPVNKFYFINSGSLYMKINGYEFIAEKNDLLLLPKNTLQSRRILVEPLDHHWVHFNCPLDQHGLDLVDTISFPNKVSLSNPNKAIELLNSLIAYNHKKDLNSRLKKIEYTTELLLFFFNNCKEINSVDTDKIFNQLTNVRLFIHDHLNMPLKIEDLAKQMHIHPNYFNTLFKKYFGIPPTQYINRLKIQRAKELLIATDQSISEISNNLGYKDMFYFSRLFKKILGTSPSNFRKLIRAESEHVES